MDGENTTGQALVDEAGQAPAGGSEQGGAPEDVGALRKEAAKWRTQFREAEKKLAAYETERMSEAERLAAQAKAAQEAATAAQQELRQTRAQAALATAASKVGVDVELVGRLVEVQFDDDGKPTNVEAALNDVLAKWPHLKPAAPTPGATNPSRKAQLTLADVKKMSTDEINARWTEVQQVLANGK